MTPLVGKIPIRKGWPGEALSAADIEEIWTQRPDADVGIVTGPHEYGGSGLLVLDLDVKGENGFDSLAAEKLALGPLPVTYMAPTPSGGAHLYFAYPDHTKDWPSTKAWRPGIDVRASGGQVAHYPGDGVVAELPAAWVAALKRAPVDLAQRAAFAPLDLTGMTDRQVEAARTAADGEAEILVEQMRSHVGRGKHLKLQDTATKLGSWLWLTHEPDRWPAAMLAACEEAHERNDVMDEWNQARAWRSVLDFVANGSAHPKRPLAPSNGTPMGSLADYGLELSPISATWRSWDDIGNAERLAEFASDRLAWLRDTGQWVAYHEPTGSWSYSSGDVMAQAAAVGCVEAMTSREIYSDPATTESFAKFAKASRSSSSVSAMVRLARSAPSLWRDLEDFDASPMLLNVANGVLDLETGEIRSHSPGFLQTQVSSVPWEPGAACPLWLRFLAEMQPDDEQRAYLQRVIGYTLTGSNAEQAFFLHVGHGANGKSVFMETIARVLGSYAQAIPKSALMLKDGDDGIPNDVARMRGKRLLRASETSAGKKLNIELLKRLSGGDAITARHMRSEFFEFVSVGKIHLVTNFPPHLDSGGHSVGRRLHEIGWEVTIPEDRKDIELPLKLATELPGILAWAVEGTRSWLDKGLAMPEKVRAAGAAHLESSDPLAEWIEVRLERMNGAECELQTLYVDYRAFAESRGERPMAARSMSAALTERGFLSYKGQPHRRVVFSNVTLRLTALQQAAGADRRFGRQTEASL